MRPFAHAVFAALYIVVIVQIMTRVSSLGGPDTILIPMAVLSLFVLSAAVMGFLFAYEPLHLYLDGKKNEALAFFVKSVAFFACFVALFLAALLYTSL